jgi:putative transposase
MPDPTDPAPRMMTRSFKYRIYPNANQTRELGIMLETHRRLYNEALAMRIASWECDRVRVGYFFQTWWLTSARKANPWYAKTNSSSGMATLKRLDLAYDAFFRGVRKGERTGFPKFKGRDWFNSFEYRHKDGARMSGDRLILQYVGDLKVKLHRPMIGDPKVVRLCREGSHWFVVFVCEAEAKNVVQSSNPPVGIDVGIESFFTTSDGYHELNPRHLEHRQSALRRLSRSVSRKKRGSANRRKAVQKVRRLHDRVRNSRLDHHHKTALKLTSRYGLIALERLAVCYMVRSRGFARVISDAGWSSFKAILKDKAESVGVRVEEVDPRNTSRTCSECGSIVEKKLKQRWHWCMCGCLLHRDVNAARNILALALARAGPTGRNAGAVMPRVPRSRRKTVCHAPADETTTKGTDHDARL